MAILEGTVKIDISLKKTKSKSKALQAGNLICDAGLAMHKDGKTTDNGRTRQKFCCPFRQSKRGVCPCNHKNWNNGKKNRGCVKYRIIPSDYRLSIDCSCLYFKRTYALRTECERYNSRFKASGQERLWVRNGNSVANLNTLAHISALAVALAAVFSGSHSYRASKSFRRSALMDVPIWLYSLGFLPGLLLMRFFSLPSNPPFFSLRPFYLERVLLISIIDASHKQNLKT